MSTSTIFFRMTTFISFQLCWLRKSHSHFPEKSTYRNIKTCIMHWYPGLYACVINKSISLLPTLPTHIFFFFSICGWVCWQWLSWRFWGGVSLSNAMLKMGRLVVSILKAILNMESLGCLFQTPFLTWQYSKKWSEKSRNCFVKTCEKKKI